jgi:glycosyltransferase involved in cell wall biosynthesis
MADLIQAAREENPGVFAMVLTKSDPGIMSERLRERGLQDADFLVKSVSSDEIPGYIASADIAISFIKPCFSKLSSSPTKIAEYLAGGIPIITNHGVGDVAELIESDKVGAVVDGFDAGSYRKALKAIESLRASPELPENCRRSASLRFDLRAVGGVKYRSLYKKILEDRL